jgi:prepilin-type N-terminal cleavage/methylation domain-containing protein
MTNRRAFTLIELIVVLSLLAVLLPMAGGTIFFLLRAESRSADALREATALSQFSHEFRSDVHAARRAQITTKRPAGPGLAFVLDESVTVEYQPEGNGFVSRTMRAGETVERREQFRLGNARSKFEIADEGREVAVTVTPGNRGFATTSDAGPPAGIRIAAIVGRNAKLGGLSPQPGPPKATSKSAPSPNDRKTP